MLAETFLKEFGRLAAGANGIRKLRELVLNLAISGRLSDQRPEDGHAQSLVEAAGKAIRSAVTSGKIRKPKYFGKAKNSTLATSLPANWIATSLGDLGLISPRNEAPDEAAAGFVPMAEIEAKFGLPHRFEERKWADIKSGYTHVANGDVVLAKITPCFENGKSTAITGLPNDLGAGTTELHVFRQLAHVVEPDYVLAFLKSESFIQAGEPRMTGTAGQKRIPADYFALSPFPLPPLAEQKRIVAKVNELMTLCDELETQQAKETEQKRATAASALHYLTEAKTPEETANRWSVLGSGFSELFDDLETIKALREGVLDFAVRGVLTNSSAHNSNSSFPVRNFYMLHVPDEWQIVELKECCSLITDGTHQTPKYTTKGRIFLSAKNVKPFRFLPDDHKFVSQADFEKYREKRRPEKGDVLLTRVGSNIGEAAVIDSDLDFAIYVSLALLKPKREVLRSDFLALWLNSPVGTATAIEKTYGRGMSQGNLNLSQIRGFRIALPPLAEQKRIVAKVDELMALCDQLEEHVRESERLNAELMATLIHSLIGTDLDHGGMPEPGGFAADAPAISPQKQANTDLGAPRTENIRNASSLEPGTRLTSDRAPSVDTKFQEAVLVAAIVKTFFEAGGEPIGNFRLQKAVYFARRRMGEHVSEMAYLRKAAGPYNPSMKYSGGIAIAKQKHWLHEARGRYGFGHVPGADIADAGEWIATYRYDAPSRWVTEHFRYKKNEEWETLATVDYVIEHLQTLGIEPDPAQIFQYIASDLEWRPKIEKLRLTEMSVATAKLEVQTLFSTEGGDK